MPSAPKLLLPQHQASSVVVIPQTNPAPYAPDAMDLNFRPPVTATGTELFAADCPLPRAPCAPTPQQYASPSAVKPHVPSPAAVREANFTVVTTAAGAARCVVEIWPVVLSPSWPALFPPQQYAVPSAVSAQVLRSAPAMRVKARPPCTATGCM